MTAEQVKAHVIEKVTGKVPSIQADADRYYGPLDVPHHRAQSALPEVSGFVLSSEDLHTILHLVNEKQKQINDAGFYSYVRTNFPDIRRQIEAELKRRGDWED